LFAEFGWVEKSTTVAAMAFGGIERAPVRVWG